MAGSDVVGVRADPLSGQDMVVGAPSDAVVREPRQSVPSRVAEARPQDAKTLLRAKIYQPLRVVIRAVLAQSAQICADEM